MLGIILQQHFGGAKVNVHPARRKQRPQSAASSQPVQTTQNCFDQAAELATKFLWNEVVGK
jgi:hypothetical protein